MRTPTRQQNSPFGTTNFTSPTTNLAPRGRAVALPVVRNQGASLPREHFEDETLPPNVRRALGQIQANVLAAIAPIKALPFGDGNLLEGVVLTTGYNFVNHGLNKAYRNVLLIGPTAYVRYHVAHQTAALDAVQAKVYVDADCTADLWIYS